MPPGVYTSEAFQALEQERIFSREWLCAGRAESIPAPGDYFTHVIGSQPVFVVRGADRGVRAFSNVCLHRMMRLLSGRGSCKRIVCPYHAWTYGLDGRLLRAQHMDRTQGFDVGQFQLPELRCEIWEGWIYVSLAPDVEPVANRLGALEPIVERYRMGEYVQVLDEDHVWDTNWKCLTENFMEGYHLPVAHRATVGAYFPAEETRFGDGEPADAFTFQWFEKTADAPIGVAHPDNTHLEGKWRRTSVLVTVFPSHMFSLAPDHLWYLSLQPDGTARVRIRYGVAFAPEVLASTDRSEERLREATAFLDRVNQEDREVVEGIFQGAQAGLSRPGPLSWLERENHEFTQYLARRLTS